MTGERAAGLGLEEPEDGEHQQAHAHAEDQRAGDTEGHESAQVADRLDGLLSEVGEHQAPQLADLGRQ